MASGISTRDEMIVGGPEVEPMFEEEPDLEDGLNVEGISVNDTVRMYLREIGRVPLLNGRQEIALARKIEIGDYLTERRGHYLGAEMVGRGYSRARRSDLWAAPTDLASGRGGACGCSISWPSCQRPSRSAAPWAATS